MRQKKQKSRGLRRSRTTSENISAHPDALHALSPQVFEHLVNALALRVLGPGLTFFCNGPDGGRDGFFQGSAPYPSQTTNWTGTWFIQSKFHSPGLSGDAQRWLRSAIAGELKAFKDPESGRNWPDNWIVVSNVDPSGTASSGTFDSTREMVRRARPQLEAHFHIWGAKKITELLATHPDIAARYGHFLTPGHVLAALKDAIAETRASDELVLRTLLSDKLIEHQATRLEEAGSETDTRPPIHRVFVDLPFRSSPSHCEGTICPFLTSTLSENHNDEGRQALAEGDEWRHWHAHPLRAPVWFVKGGPGHGKSTIGQFIAQVHRAALLIAGICRASQDIRDLAEEVRSSSERLGLWPLAPRIPIVLELKKYAQWLSRRTDGAAAGLITFLADELTAATEETVTVAALRRLLKGQRNLFVFDGLDEVPSEQKDAIAGAIKHLISELRSSSDLFALCTSRPQGYSGQFDNIPRVAQIELVPLPPTVALSCAQTLLLAERHRSEANAALERLNAAFQQSQSIRELMRTPLQVHIMCVIVRSGHRPPERRWALFNVFYNVIRQREANRNLADKDVAAVLQREAKLLREVHARLGFLLHARAETAEGAESQLSHADFSALVRIAVEQAKDEGIHALIATVMRAARDRLVLINTPVAAGSYRFDVRQLQEFFAGEFIYSGVEQRDFRARMKLLTGDQHWREVIHFVLSALVEQDRRNELVIAVDVLRQLDRGGDYEEEENLASHLARGASAVAQLILDGVLDEDRTVRNMFRDLLTPLVSCTDASQLRSLVKACGSRQWLREFILNRAEERIPERALGAARVLWYATSDDDPLLARVQRWLEGVSDGLLASWMWSERGDDTRACQYTWHVSMLAHRLTRAIVDYEGTGELVRAIWGKRLSSVLKSFGASPGLEDLFHIRYVEDGKGRVRMVSRAPSRAPAVVGSHLELLRKLPDSGVLGLWRRAYTCAYEPTLESYQSLLRTLGDSWDGLALLLPTAFDPELGIMIPRETPLALADRLTREEHWEHLTAPILNVVRGDVPSKPAANHSEFSELLRLVPSHAIEQWLRDKVEGKNGSFPWLADAEVAGALLGNPKLLRRVPVFLLRELFKLSPELRSAAAGSPGMKRLGFCENVHSDQAEFERLDLGVDSFLLPRLAGELLSRIWFLSNGYAAHSDSRPHSELVEAMVSLFEVRALLTNNCTPPHLAAGAAVLLMLGNPGEWQNVIHWRKALVQHACIDSSFGPALAFCIEKSGLLWDPNARALVSELLGQEQLRHMWVPVLSRWRERSQTPLSGCETVFPTLA